MKKNTIIHFYLFIVLSFIVFGLFFYCCPLLKQNSETTYTCAYASDDALTKTQVKDTDLNRNTSIFSLGAINLETGTTPITSFSNVHEISRNEYFKQNPLHRANDNTAPSINIAGVCSTVAMQMLMGYHAYYSDRRLIPYTGYTFLDSSFGNISRNPDLFLGQLEIEEDSEMIRAPLGDPAIGTTDDFFDEIVNRTTWPSFPGLGQNMPAIVNAANSFVNAYASSIANNVSISFGLYSSSDVQSDINSGKPVALGFDPLFSDATKYHVVVAYGYATSPSNVFGYIVHCGWRDDTTYVWIPASWFGFQIRMSVAHSHTYTVGSNYVNSHKIVTCSTCNAILLSRLYSTNSTGNEITGVNYTPAGDIVMPERLYGKTVTEIGDEAFKNQTGITSFDFPDSIIEIGESAFSGCTNLLNIDFNTTSQLTTIGREAFKGCNNLSGDPGATIQGIYLPNSIETIGFMAFYNCASFKPVLGLLPENLTTIGDWAFAQTAIVSVIIPDGVTRIEDATFFYISTLTSVTLNENVTYIGQYAFYGCSALQSFLSSGNVTTVKYGAFQDCTALTSRTCPNATTIEERAYYGCTAMTGTLTIKFGTTSIGDYAFYNCTSLTGLDLPSSLDVIGERAFYNCNSIIGDIEIIGLESLGKYAFYNCSGITDFYLYSSLESIGEYAFYNCSSIHSVTLISSTMSVGQYAFRNCTNLTIYTTKTSASGWGTGWNYSNRPVFYGCSVPNYSVTSFTKSNTNPANRNAINGINNPTKDGSTFGGWYTTSDHSGTQYMDVTTAPNGVLYAKWNSSSCIAAGSLITLADGTQVAVENLTGNESLLVWNMLTGQYDTAPILFIDSDPLSTYEVITLTFSDNTQVKVISEHAFFDMTIGEYVFLRNDAAQYIGHYFNKKNGNTWTTVQLTNVSVGTEYTTAWSPVTYGHLCYYVNGMLTMPGATEGFINIFDVDTTLMQYEAEQMAEDIQTYGLYTYEEFNAIIPLPELVFNAFNGQYLKVSIGKGLVTLPEIIALLERYAEFFN